MVHTWPGPRPLREISHGDLIALRDLSPRLRPFDRAVLPWLRLAAEHITSDRIAAATGLPEDTVWYRLRRARAAFGAATTAEAVRRAHAAGLLTGGQP